MSNQLEKKNPRLYRQNTVLHGSVTTSSSLSPLFVSLRNTNPHIHTKYRLYPEVLSPTDITYMRYLYNTLIRKKLTEVGIQERLPLTLTALARGCVLIISISEEVAGHQTPHAINLRHEEPIVIHVPVHVDYLPRLETELGLKKPLYFI